MVESQVEVDCALRRDIQELQSYLPFGGCEGICAGVTRWGSAAKVGGDEVLVWGGSIYRIDQAQVAVFPGALGIC
jgi:hypothetical protein